MHESPSFTEKFLDGIEEAARVAENARSSGKTVVMTNGCFDLLHVGHVRSIEDAKRLGDYLFVGLNSDRAVRELKGEGQPITPERERVEVVACLAAVDFVFIFDDFTADKAILAIRPDIHAKGTDYTEASDPERASVLSYGGRTAIVGDPKGHATRQIIKRLKK